MNANDIGKIERGVVTYPRAPRRAALRKVLNAEADADLGLFDSRSSPSDVDGGPAAQSWSADHGWGADLAGAEHAFETAPAYLRRRSFLQGMAMVALAAGLEGPAEGRRRQIGFSDVARVNAVTALYRSTDGEFGGTELADDVTRFADRVSGLIDHQVPERVRRPLLSAISGARYLAAWTAFDATRHNDAFRHFNAAERFAAQSGDSRLLAYVRYGQAKQLQHLRQNRDALHSLQLAHHELDSTPGVLTILRGAEAASRAAIGDSAGALRALGQSSEAFADVEPASEPDWLSFLDKGELLAQYGRVYRDMARRDRNSGDDAVRWVSDAISLFEPQNQRSTVLNQIGLCSAYFLAGAPELAVHAGRAAQQNAAAISSARTIERLANLRRDANHHLHHPDVAAFVRGLPRPSITTV